MSVTWRDVSDVWYEGLHEADLNGIYGEVAPAVDGDGWFWMVKPLGTRSEFPEVYDCGPTATQVEAQEKAAEAMVRADAAYPTMGKDGW